MKTRRITALVGLALLAVALTILALGLSGGAARDARAQEPVTVGFDMNTAGNTCPNNGTDCTLGSIDACVEVPPGGGVITIDVFLDDLPVAVNGFSGFQYTLGEKLGQPVGTVTAFMHNDIAVNLVVQVPNPVFLDFSDSVPAPLAGWMAQVLDLSYGFEANPPFTKGVLSRLTIDTTGAPDGVYGLTIDPPGTANPLMVADVNGEDYCNPGGPNYVGCDILDVNAGHGIIAIGVPCPTYTDVEIESQQVRAGNCTDPPPVEMDVDTDTVLCLHKTIANNGPETPVDGTITTDPYGPGDCTITPDGANPAAFNNLQMGMPQEVDEKFTINCAAPSEHYFDFANAVELTGPPDVIDPNLDNNYVSTGFSIAVTATADVAIDSQALVDPPAVIITGADTPVTLRKHVLNNGPSGPVDVVVTAVVPSPPPNCSATLASQSPANPVTLPLSIDVVVDEDWTVNCGAEATGVVFTFNNSVSPTVHVGDPTPGNNSASTDLVVDVVSLLGDVNCDGESNVGDAIYIFQYVMGRRTESFQCPLPVDTLYLPMADVNGDTVIDMVDAGFVFRCWMGYQNVFCPAVGTAGPTSVQQQEATVGIEGKEVAAGGSEVTRLEAFNVASSLCFVTVDITYDPQVKIPVDCVATVELFDSGADCNIQYGANTVRFGGIDASEGLVGDIPLADITWNAVGSVGDSTSLDVTVVTFTDCDGNPISVTTEDGTNTIVSPTPTPTPTPTPPGWTPTPTPTPIPQPGGGTFNPTMTAQISDATADANADITTTFDIPDGDLQFAVLYTGVPEEFFPGEEVPLGALVGQIDSVSTVALFNGSCTTGITPHFPLWKAALDDAGCTVTWQQQSADDDADGLQNGIECWPEFLDRMLPAGATPLERFYGETQVGASPVSENIVAIAASDVGLSSEWGIVQIAILNDMGDPERPVRPREALTDYCTPLSSQTITFGLSQDNGNTPGDESGFEVRRNPHYGGTYTFNFRAISMYNSDNDGIENYQDTCPLTTNTEDSPHVETIPMGPDGDGIDASCDPDPAVACGGTPFPNCSPQYEPNRATDCDCDGFWNRLDTCPLVPNGCNDEACAGGWPWNPSWSEQADADGDTIGDDCDPDPNSPDGGAFVVWLESDVYIAGEACAPVIPGTYYGTVTINGQPAPDGTLIQAFVQGLEWASTATSGGNYGNYVVDIPPTLPVSPPCFEGGWLSFQADGAWCEPSVQWNSGLHYLDLTCGEIATKVRIGSGHAPPGGQVTLPLDALDVPPPGLGAFTVDIAYEAGVVTPTGYVGDPDSRFDAVLCNLNYGPSTIRCTGIRATSDAMGDLMLADITFEVAPDAPMGYQSPLALTVATFADTEGYDIPHATEDGSIRVGLVGDVDCDQDVDAVDALFILQYVVGLRSVSNQCPAPAGTLYLPAADAQCDSDVDAVDALFVLQHVVGLRPELCPAGGLPTPTATPMPSVTPTPSVTATP